MNGATAVTIKKLENIERSGGELLIASADVTDSAAMTAVVAAAKERFGTIHGVIHAAGVLHDGIAQLKRPDIAAQVLAPKVLGTLVLVSVLKDFSLDFIALFSSTSAVLGLAGQVDYTAANAFLNAFARSRQSSTTTVVSLGWGPWLEVGMAARTAGKISRSSSVVTDRAIDYPFLDACIKETPDETVYSAEYRLDDHWLLNEHQIDGFGALMPGTGYLEVARACFEQQTGVESVEIRDVLFMSPFRVSGNDRPELRISLKSTEEGYLFRMASQDSNGRFIDHAEGTLHGLSREPRNGDDLSTIRSRCKPSSNGHSANSFFKFGPRWDALKQIAFGSGEALALVELGDRFVGDLSRVKLHPALLDIATSCALPLLEGFDPNTEFYVPVSCSSLRMYEGLPRTFYSHLRLENASKERESATFNITLLASGGHEIAAIKEFTFRRATKGSLLVSSRRAVEGRVQGQTSVVGISPAKGVEAFERALNSFSQEPEIFISPRLQDQIRRGEDPETPGVQEATGKIAAPQLPRLSDTDSIVPSPQDDVEDTLSKIWKSILAMEKLGARDNVFDAGADSLSALRALTQIKRQLKISLSVAALYDHPTVHELTKLVREQRS